jgi:DNA polymerase III alpha subunit
MKTTEYGDILLTSDEVFKAIYSGQITDIKSVILADLDELIKFNSAVKINYDDISELKSYSEHTESVDHFDKNNQQNWFMPDEYKQIDIEEYLVSICPTENYERLVEELSLFRQHGMMDVLKYLKYFVDTMREHKIVWGVGRGSSVASYCLYLLGVHKIDSVKYKLDINEFLK